MVAEGAATGHGTDKGGASPAEVGAPPSGTAGSAGRTWLLGLLTVAFGLNLLDRQIINILAEPIKRDLALSDSQLGALTGLSFALLYSVMALPIARRADRGDRVRIVGAAILTWSLFTAACGAAASFVQLLLLRIGVGVGEAGCAPPSQSLIADEYPPERRAGALAIFALGSPIGAAVGLVAGGLLAGAIGWRWTMVAAGAPGLIVGALVLVTLSDRHLHRSEVAAAPLGTVLARLARNRSFLLVIFGCALLSFVNYGAMAFAGSFYLRVHVDGIGALAASLGLPPIGVIGLGLGLLGGAGGAVGAIVGGRLGNRRGESDPARLVRISAVGSLLCAASYAAMFTVPSAAGSLAIFFVASFFSNLWYGPGTLAIQLLAGQNDRATALAISLFVNSLVGLGLGPTTVGLMSDAFAPTLGSGEGLRLAVLIGLSAGMLSAILYWLSSRSIAADVSRPATGVA